MLKQIGPGVLDSRHFAAGNGMNWRVVEKLFAHRAQGCFYHCRARTSHISYVCRIRGMPADFDDILKNVKERDYIDSHRETSPLRMADDALELDNSHMTIEEQKAWLMARYKEKAEA